MRVTMLGCGSSSGVPYIGCSCAVCTSDNPKNKRTRVSVFVEVGGKNILIDTSPDLRAQALRENITQIDAVLYTHDHADHTHGIDELRSFNYLKAGALPIYGNAQTLNSLQNRFNYAFMPKLYEVWNKPYLLPHAVVDKAVGEFSLFDQKIAYFEQMHGKIKSVGYRIENFAYSTDVNALSEEVFAALEGVEVWIVDCLRFEPSFSHSHLDLTLEWISRVKPKRAILTHMNHDFDYETLNARLPEGVEMGYDGLVIEL